MLNNKCSIFNVQGMGQETLEGVFTILLTLLALTEIY